ncbi:MAG: penicillin-binding protein 2 [Desulfobacterales bacterium]|nr:penicillin-binding protein 2 [Desulfobacterales bacterium]
MEIYLNNHANGTENDEYKRRLFSIMVVVFTGFIILIIRLFYLQIIEGEEYKRLSENNCIRLQSIDPPRGLIFDRGGYLLADNRPSFDVSIIVKDAKPVKQTVEKLSNYILTPKSELLTKINRQKGLSYYKPMVLKQDIGWDNLAVVEVHKFELPGIDIDVRSRRHYINKYTASHVIGYLGEINPELLKLELIKNGESSEYRSGDFIGKCGVEKSYENYLRGKRGGRQVEVDVTGRVVKVLKTIDAKPGHNIYMTIDYDLQRRAEELIADVVGSVVAMEISSGDVLAMASTPSFDQNIFVSGMTKEQWDDLTSNSFKPLQNRATQCQYPPASTYKIITALAGLEEKVIDEHSTVFCPGYYRFGNRPFRCWRKGGHGKVDTVTAIAQSCDVFFYHVGQKLGVDKIAHYAKACGLGAQTGIALENEVPGIVPTSDWKKKTYKIPWQKGETLSIAIGQGYDLVTPLQLAVVMTVIANDGVRYKPLIVRRVETVEGKTVYEGKPEIISKISINPKSLAIIKKGLWAVVDHGTGKGSKLPNIEMSGKTGTAQIITTTGREEKLPYKYRPHAWFVAYAPSSNPKIAISVLVEHGEHGASAAAPVAKELVKTYFSKNKLKSDQSYALKDDNIKIDEKSLD